MRKEEVVSSLIMVVVCGLVMIGFTIAWYTNRSNPVATGLELEAIELGSVKVALTSGGKDILELDESEQYADIGVEDFTNLEAGKLAPGAYGKVTFYVTPVNESVATCNIVPKILITQDGSSWYPDSNQANNEIDGQQGSGDEPEQEVNPEMLYALTQSHICFFADEDMTVKVTPDAPYQMKWTESDNQAEKPAVLYWKWFYEYPFSPEEASLTEEEKRAKIEQYDEEDRVLGNNVTGMKFHFTFSVQ